LPYTGLPAVPVVDGVFITNNHQEPAEEAAKPRTSPAEEAAKPRTPGFRSSATAATAYATPQEEGLGRTYYSTPGFRKSKASSFTAVTQQTAQEIPAAGKKNDNNDDTAGKQKKNSSCGDKEDPKNEAGCSGERDANAKVSVAAQSAGAPNPPTHQVQTIRDVGASPPLVTSDKSAFSDTVRVQTVQPKDHSAYSASPEELQKNWRPAVKLMPELAEHFKPVVTFGKDNKFKFNYDDKKSLDLLATVLSKFKNAKKEKKREHPTTAREVVARVNDAVRLLGQEYDSIKLTTVWTEKKVLCEETKLFLDKKIKDFGEAPKEFVYDLYKCVLELNFLVCLHEKEPANDDADRNETKLYKSKSVRQCLEERFGMCQDQDGKCSLPTIHKDREDRGGIGFVDSVKMNDSETLLSYFFCDEF